MLSTSSDDGGTILHSMKLCWHLIEGYVKDTPLSVIGIFHAPCLSKVTEALCWPTGTQNNHSFRDSRTTPTACPTARQTLSQSVSRWHSVTASHPPSGRQSTYLQYVYLLQCLYGTLGYTTPCRNATQRPRPTERLNAQLSATKGFAKPRQKIVLLSL